MMSDNDLDREIGPGEAALNLRKAGSGSPQPGENISIEIHNALTAEGLLPGTGTVRLSLSLEKHVRGWLADAWDAAIKFAWDDTQPSDLRYNPYRQPGLCLGRDPAHPRRACLMLRDHDGGCFGEVDG